MARGEITADATPAFAISSSRIAGQGAFATRAIAKGDRLIEYVGERLTHAAADARYDDRAHDKHHTFLFAVNRSTVIDATVEGNDSRFINHACEPNCESVIERGRVFIDAIRAIRKGEELTYDYAYARDGTETEEEETTLYVCRCGSRRCRGTILAPLSRAELKRRTLAAKKRHHPPHVVARTGHVTK
jgi:uncharacterized protein